MCGAFTIIAALALFVNYARAIVSVVVPENKVLVVVVLV